MKYVAGKSWPWPVLRPESDDYERCEFQVDITVDYLADSTAVKVEAEFVLSDRDLLDLIDAGRAEYALLISCSATHYRRTVTSADLLIECEVPEGRLVGHVECSPYLVCIEPVQQFRAANWHADYGDRRFDFECGAVLAQDHPVAAWIDSADESSITSIFRVSRTDQVNAGQWRCELNEDGRVHIQLHPNDYERFNAARGRPVEETGAYILNSVYLPALLWLLDEADRMTGPETGHELWWNALDSALEGAGLVGMGSGGDRTDRLSDAQVLFQQPFGRLPLLKESQ